jgi:hypothetical protein
MKILSVPQVRPVMQALVSGDLDLRSGCSAVARSQGKVTLVWAGPVDTSDGRTIRYSGQRVEHGQRVSLTGGFVELSEFPGLAVNAASLGCAPPYFLVQGLELSR